jgi:hypothetical protein
MILRRRKKAGINAELFKDAMVMLLVCHVKGSVTLRNVLKRTLPFLLIALQTRRKRNLLDPGKA